MIGLLDFVFWLGHGLYFLLLSIENIIAKLAYQLYRIARFTGREKAFTAFWSARDFSAEMSSWHLSMNVSLAILLLYYVD